MVFHVLRKMNENTKTEPPIENRDHTEEVDGDLHLLTLKIRKGLPLRRLCCSIVPGRVEVWSASCDTIRLFKFPYWVCL